MPNGGSDCCGTCGFNSQVRAGRHPYDEPDPETTVRCVIRDVDIDMPFWTYCANHPHHNPRRIELPIGPIYIDSGDGFPYRRKVLVPSPDTSEIRFELLSLLVDIDETPPDEYPTSTQLDETVIRQLGEFREGRAVAEFRRILNFEPFASSPDGDRNRIPLIACAVEALAKTIGDEAVDDVRRCLTAGVDAARQLDEYQFADDPLASIRYAAAEALAHLLPDRAAELAALAAGDPNAEVAETAGRFLAR